jgi:hypothetical protein
MIRGRKMPKEPLALPRAVRLRERAAALEAKAEELLREARALLASAEEIEGERSRRVTAIHE